MNFSGPVYVDISIYDLSKIQCVIFWMLSVSNVSPPRFVHCFCAYFQVMVVCKMCACDLQRAFSPKWMNSCQRDWNHSVYGEMEQGVRWRTPEEKIDWEVDVMLSDRTGVFKATWAHVISCFIGRETIIGIWYENRKKLITYFVNEMSLMWHFFFEEALRN